MSEEVNNSELSSLVEREQIEGTPFQMVKLEVEGYGTNYHIGWGEYALTHGKQTKEEALSLLETDKWNIMGVYAVSIINMTLRLKNGAEDLSKTLKIHSRSNEETQ